MCGRDPAGLDAASLARAVVESVAENTSDAVVAPLVWGAVAGLPGLAAYRAVNTLDAMVGYRTPRHANFGWAAARLDDAANWVPARLTGLLAAACAPAAGGRAASTLHAMHRYGGRHPSPNAGRCEAAFAGALGVRLGGTNVYAGHTEHRPALGDGRAPGSAISAGPCASPARSRSPRPWRAPSPRSLSPRPPVAALARAALARTALASGPASSRAPA